MPTAGRGPALKAAFWFVVIIFMLGYIPDRAYYFTVFSTIDLGINADLAGQPVPAREQDPAVSRTGRRGGAMGGRAAELSLPAPRVDGDAIQVGTKILYIGGSRRPGGLGQGLRRRCLHRRQLQPVEGRPGPAGAARASPRSRSWPAPSTSSGGYDAPAHADDDDLHPDAGRGHGRADARGRRRPTRSCRSTCPRPAAGASLVACSDGLLLVGGAGPTASRRTPSGSRRYSTGKLGAWKPTAPMVQPGASGIEHRRSARRRDGRLVGRVLLCLRRSRRQGPTTPGHARHTRIPRRAPGGSPQPAPSPAACPGRPSRRAPLGGRRGRRPTCPLRGPTPPAVHGERRDLPRRRDRRHAPKGELYWAVPDSNGNIP